MLVFILLLKDAERYDSRTYTWTGARRDQDGVEYSFPVAVPIYEGVVNPAGALQVR